MKTFIDEETNIEIIIGQNAQENWDIIDNADQSEIWFHLDSFPSPHVIIKHTNPPKNIIYQAAFLCKDYSKYKNYKNLKIIYTTCKNIKKTEVKGSVIIKGKTNKITI